MNGVITKKEVSQLRLKGKPKCQCCNNPLSYVYEGSEGLIGEKCSRCGESFVVNTKTLEVFKILDKVS